METWWGVREERRAFLQLEKQVGSVRSGWVWLQGGLGQWLVTAEY